MSVSLNREKQASTNVVRRPIIDISLEESEKAGPDLVGRHDREPSIQVLEPNAHTTYTVPSDLDTESDSDESLVLETSSSIIVKDAQSSNVTTPDQAVAAIKEQSPSSPLSVSNQPTTSEGKPKGAPLSEIIAKTALHAQGSSQIDPINVDGDNSKDDAGSEEEGPEELPTTTHKKRSNILRLLNEGSPSPQKPQAHDKPNTNGEIKEASMTEESDLSDSDQDDAFPLDDDAIFDVDSDFEPSDAAQDTPDLAKTHGAPLDNAGTLAPDTRALPVSLPVIDLDEDLEMDMDRNSIYQSRTRDGVSDLYSKYYPEENSMYPPQMMHTYAEIRNRLLPAMQNEFRDTAWTRDAHPTGNALLGKEVGSNPKFTKPLNISKATGVSSSKLNISNLINPNSLDQRQTSKRTWEQMNHDDDPEVMYYPKAFNQGCSQETQQPDAQPQQHLPTPRETRATTTQTDSVTPSISASVAPPVVLLSSAVPAPAPKRAKTSRFGRFGRDLTTLASGVCLGAVGLAVALITTVPASVHEEALREI